MIADDALVDRWCELMHDAYEAAALAEGWETQAQSRVPWSDVPDANRRTMRAAVTALLPEVRKAQAEAWDRGWNACVEYVDGPDCGPAPTNPYRAERQGREAAIVVQEGDE